MAYVEHYITATSPSTNTTSAATKVLDKLDAFDWFTITAKLQGATGGTLDVYLQRWVGALQEWHDWIHFTQLAAAASAVRYVCDSRMSATSVTTVGHTTTPVISANVVTVSHPGTKVRMLFVAGASTSAGASQTVVLGCWKSR